MSRTRLRTVAPLVAMPLALLLALPAQAKKLEPPTKSLRTDTNSLVRAEALGTVEQGHVTFKVLETLHGEAGTEVTLRIGPEGQAVIAPGKTYLVAFSDLIRSPREGYYEKDPEGPKAITIPSVGDAVLEDSAELRSLFSPAPTARQQLDAVLGQLRRPDVLSARTVAAELVLRGDLRDLVQPEERTVLETLLLDAKADALLRDLVFRASLPMAPRLGGDWLANASRATLRQYGLKLDFSTFVPTLLVTAGRVLGETGGEKDLELLSGHLYSNNPEVAKSALEAMDKLAPKVTQAKIATLVNDEALQAETRNAMRIYLAGKAREAGTSG